MTTPASDTRIVYVCDKLRELQRLFGDLCFDPNTPQEEIDKETNPALEGTQKGGYRLCTKLEPADINAATMRMGARRSKRNPSPNAQPRRSRIQYRPTTCPV